jgi:hypothetical protein
VTAGAHPLYGGCKGLLSVAVTEAVNVADRTSSPPQLTIAEARHMQSAQLSVVDDSDGIRVVRGRAVQLDPPEAAGLTGPWRRRVEGSRRPIRRTMQGP